MIVPHPPCMEGTQVGLVQTVKNLFTRPPEGAAKQLLAGVYTQEQITAPKKGTGDYLKAYSTHPWLRAAESVIAEGVASVQWKMYAVKKNNKLSAPGKLLTLSKAVQGGGSWYHHRAMQSASKEYRTQYLKQARAVGELVEIEDHPMLDALYNMNPYLTGWQTRKLVTVFLDIAGESFLLKEKNSAGIVIGLWPVPSHWVRTTPTPQHPYFTIHWGNGRKVDNVSEKDILWMVDPDPFNPYARGSGKWMAAGDELDLSEFIQKYQKAFFHNMARPDFIVSLDGLGPDQTRRFEQGWNSQHQGFWNAFKAHFVNRKLEVHNIQGSFKDQQLTEMTNLTRDHLAQIIGLPPEKLGIVESSNRATSEAADVTFTKDVVTPRAEFQRSYYQERLLPEYDPRLVIDFESPVPADKTRELEAAKAAPHVLTVDEWRELTGHGSLPDDEGNVYIIQGQPKVIESFTDLADMQEEDRTMAREQFGFGDSNNDEAMADTVEQDEEDQEDVEDDGEDDDKWMVMDLTKHDNPYDFLVQSNRSFASPVFERSFPKGTLSHKTMFVDGEDVPSDIEYTDVHRLADKFYGPLRRNILNNFKDIKEAIDFDKLVKLLTMQEPSESVMDAIPLNMLQGFKGVTEESDLKLFIRTTMASLAGLAAEQAVKRMAQALRQDIRFANLKTDAIAWASQYASNMVRNISAATREAIKDIIIQAYQESWAPVESARIIRNIVGLDPNRSRQVVKFWKKLVDSDMDPDKIAARVERYSTAQIRKRAMTIARTETINTANQGQQLAWDRAVVEGVLDKDEMVKIWITTPDDRLDLIVCEPMPSMDENQDVPIDGQFTTGDGRKISQPTAHPNCRCTTALVMKGQ
jgi:HK97 family phage portal protein